MLVPAHAIVIKPDPFSTRYDVEVVPPMTDGPCHDQDFTDLRKARGYASGLRMVTGFKITDLCGAPDAQG